METLKDDYPLLNTDDEDEDFEPDDDDDDDDDEDFIPLGHGYYTIHLRRLRGLRNFQDHLRCVSNICLYFSNI